MKLRFVGCGDAFGSGGRFNTCLHLESSDAREHQRSMLIDCGATSLVALKKWGIDPHTIGWIALSHLHGDHFAGVPWLLLDGRFGDRRRPLAVAGPPTVEQRIQSTFQSMYPAALEAELPFEVSYHELSEGEPLQFGPAAVTPFEVIHESGAPSFGLRVQYAGRVIAYSGDTEWTDNLIALAAGADVFVCECNCWEKPIPGHLDYPTLLQRREQLDCRRLILTHLGPEMLAHRAELEFEVAVDGVLVDV